MESRKRRVVESESESDEADSGGNITVESDDYDEVWAVNRILAERKGSDGVVRFLVLWEGFPDYRSSWEPKENFESSETLEDWEHHKAIGDTLDPAHLEQLEIRINLYNNNEPGYEAPNDGDKNTLQIPKSSTSLEPRPKKRVKYEDRRPKHVARPPVNKSQQNIPSKLGTVDGHRRSSQAPTPPISDSSTSPESLPLKRVKASTAKSKAIQPVAKTPNSQKTKQSKSRKTGSDTRFNGLQHMGRARKKAAQEPPVNPDDPSLVFVSSASTAQRRDSSAEWSMFVSDKEPQDKLRAAESSLVSQDSDLNEASAQSRATSPKEVAREPVITRTLLTNPKHKVQEDLPQQGVAIPSNLVSTVQAQNASSAHGVNLQDTGPIGREAELVSQPCGLDTLSHVGGATSASGSTTNEVPIGDLKNDTHHEEGKEQAEKSIQTEGIPSTVSIEYTVPEPQLQGPQTTPSETPALSIMRARNGLSWAKDELVVHLSLGNYNIGPVRVADFSQPIRSALINYKRKLGHYQIEMHFMQENVLTALEYQDLERNFVSSGPQTARIVPFEQSAGIVRELAHKYLVLHDLTAVYILPTIPEAFVLYSRQAPSWLARGKYQYPQGQPDLMLQAYRLEPSTLSRLGSSHYGFNLQDRFVLARPHTAEKVVLKQPTDPAEQALIEPPIRAASFHADSSTQVEKREFRRTLTSAVAPYAIGQKDKHTGETFGEDINDREQRSKTDPTSCQKTRCTTSTKELLPAVKAEETEGEALSVDWEVDLDWHALLSSVKHVDSSAEACSVFIGLPAKYSLQAAALRNWASKHTAGARVLEAHDWPVFLDLLKSDNPKLVFFHAEGPSYATLSKFNLALFRPDVLYFQVSWTMPSACTKVRYETKPLFSQGQAVLLLEEVMVKTPALALSALTWFHNSYKDRGRNHYQMMLRPNILEWLVQRQILLTQQGKYGEAKVMLEMLQLLEERCETDAMASGETEVVALPVTITNSLFVAFPGLMDEYDVSASASMELDEIRKRDTILLEHFVGFATAAAAQFRKFLVLHNKHATVPPDGQHIALRGTKGFMEEVERKGKETKK